MNTTVTLSLTVNQRNALRAALAEFIISDNGGSDAIRADARAVLAEINNQIGWPMPSSIPDPSGANAGRWILQWADGEVFAGSDLGDADREDWKQPDIVIDWPSVLSFPSEHEAQLALRKHYSGAFDNGLVKPVPYPVTSHATVAASQPYDLSIFTLGGS